MQQAIPYKAWSTLPLDHVGTNKNPTISEKGAIREAVSDNAVIVLARKGCCMSHVVKRLLIGHGVNPSVFEFEEVEEKDVVKELEIITTEKGTLMAKPATRVQFPAVFIGGKMYGGLDQVMATHISGELVPVLKQAGALWL